MSITSDLIGIANGCITRVAMRRWLSLNFNIKGIVKSCSIDGDRNHRQQLL